jgi:ELWxxDGT repeat protein
VESAEAGGKLFLLTLGPGGFAFWRTDGTAAGTVPLRDSSSHPLPRYITDLCAVSGAVFFVLYLTPQVGDPGPQLWITDGTVAGTRPVVDPGPGQAFFNPFSLRAMNGRLYFFATGADGLLGLWRSDGTAAGTVKVKGFEAPYVTLPLPTVHAGRLWFFAAMSEGRVLWSSDGTESGTRIERLPGLPQASFMASIGTKLMISGYVPGSGFELWATDGTPAGTRKVGPALYNSAPRTPWTVFQGRLVHAVDEQLIGYPKLWTSDGTPEGTGPLLDHDGQPIPVPLGIAALGDHFIFTTAIPARVWESDGTPAGTRPIARLRPFDFNPDAVVRAGNRVFFGAWDPATGQELWAVEP